MKSQSKQASLSKIREVLATLEPGGAHQASIAPDPTIIFAPITHASALDPERALVVGNRGVGKSFWSAVLVHSSTRKRVAKYYPKLPLEKLIAVLGYHEDAGKDDGPAPSQAALADALSKTESPEQIWRAVLLRALEPNLSINLPSKFIELIQWSVENYETVENALRHVDKQFLANGQKFLLVFDALDRLGRDWSSISRLTEGLVRFALDIRGYKSIRAKIFMRTDQANDDELFRFADASKIRAGSVKLVWQRLELFGLLYNQLLGNREASEALKNIAKAASKDALLNDPKTQEIVFYSIAGEFMGADAKRGRTYSWLYDHLADAFGETSPRSFLTALQKAANTRPFPTATAIDHNGIRAGVQDASEVRVAQLKEDYNWIEAVLNALDGLEVPCEPSVFKKRWKQKFTVDTIRLDTAKSNELLPLEIERSRSDREEALLTALNNIGVVEFRAENRINVPDIFRIAARIKRRGGIRPPKATRRK